MLVRLLRLVLGRALLLALGMVLSLLVLEVVLQVGAAVIPAAGRSQITHWTQGRQRIVCVGDSNTYGLYVKREEAYPEVLERLWNAADRPIEVLNLGVPGTNSSRLLAGFPHILDTFAPDLAIVMIGVNDFWTVPVPVDDGVEAKSWLYSIWRASRTFRFLYMVRRLWQKDQLTVEFRPSVGSQPPRGVVHYGDDQIDLTFTARADEPDAAWPVGLRHNLERIADQARAAGTRLVLATYPSESPEYAAANQVIREVAAAVGAPLADLGRAFRKECPEVVNCPEILREDRHPTPSGHQLAAATLVRFLRTLPAS